MTEREQALERTRLHLAAALHECFAGGIIDAEARQRATLALDEISTEELREIVRGIEAYRVQAVEVVG